ncbi:hypothetical protein MNEG_15882 [Monoraphidium neglectum]|uniref:Uncharacterized protein n=1 Tax=Monoraphidium neglectum TaxID=145388 RepID=A0A0D2LQ61_9CHLO|nr:hypothetical protein MNEG_15882 [Monoraphidium neglectum]KIY92081.1 hypothetical protein MNEG_15882 [Monoraphidium neglectum]|eukprot:XP_013891101.1 hypothetical protein MNEG_15882 [Monoraphidium neglectum]
MEAAKPVLSMPWVDLQAVQALLPVWGLFLAGVLVGQLLPRISRAVRLPKTLPISSLLTRWSQAVLVFHLAVILKEVWHHVAHPGTLRGLLRATVQWACGRGWSFQWPASIGSDGLLDVASDSSSSSEGGELARSEGEW